MDHPEKEPSTLDKKPPLFKSWKQIYGAVLAILLVLVVLFYLFTVQYS